MSDSQQSCVRVLLADDHDILRQGLKMLLSLQPEIAVVGEARTGRETVTQALSLRPDVVVLDISMPDIDGLEACRQIRARAPAPGVLMLTMHESEEFFFQALRAGAAGYLVKKAAPPDVQMAILAVARGGAFLYPGLARALVNAYTAVSPAAQPAGAERIAQTLRVLSPRELEVLKLVARGYTNQEIAEQLVLSIKTVQAHRANVMAKLGLENIAHLVRFAVRSGLLPSDI
ncbi:MAG TPA: response regulator transcription factor [Ktedonobacteraceae bacterium]